MRRGSPALGLLRTLATALALVQAAPLALFASPPQQVTQSVTATATFTARTSLEVSARVLQFQVAAGSTSAEASVEFAVGARTRPGGEVALVVEMAEPSATQHQVTIAGGSEGVVAGPVGATPAVVARWAGGGMRTGQVVGSSNSRGEVPKDRPLEACDLHATIYTIMGVSPKTAFTVEKRPFYATEDGKGQAVSALFA